MARFALVLLFAACKGESPTAPSPGSGGTPTPTPQPTGINVVLTASNASPSVDGTVIITATVTQDGQAVPNGTAVEFSTTGGAFDNTTDLTAVIKTTTNGVATVQLTSTVPGPVTVRAIVNNVSRNVLVTFRVDDPDPTPEPTAPSITRVEPAIGRPSGSQTIRIIGTNFHAPLRVLFDVGLPLPVEATIVSSSLTHIDVITPGVNLGAGQQLVADIIVLSRAGTATEERALAADVFTFRNEQLQPRFSTASPNSGPVTGGTRVTIFGDGFQAPVQVLFGQAEAKVINVDFGQIIVEAPAGRDTSDTGSGTVVGPVPITIRNIDSQLAVTAAGAFRYVAAVDITNFRPIVGPSTGGTDVVIDGIGFLAPVDVNIAGIRATVLQVTGTRILARTGPLPSSCANVAGGTVMVTNANNGDHDIHGDATDEETFTYIPVPALITAITGPGAGTFPGNVVTVSVRDPGVGILGNADIRFSVLDRTLIPTPDRITNGTGIQQFGVALPLTGFNFPTVSCSAGVGITGSQLGPVEVPITFLNTTSGCTATGTVLVQPPAPNPCVAPAEVEVTAPASTSCPGLQLGSVTTGSSAQGDIVIRNSATAPALSLNVTSVSSSNAAFQVSPSSANNITPGTTRNFTVTFAPTAAGAQTATITFNTNDPDEPTVTVCVSGTGTAPGP